MPEKRYTKGEWAIIEEKLRLYYFKVSQVREQSYRETSRIMLKCASDLAEVNSSEQEKLDALRKEYDGVLNLK